MIIDDGEVEFCFGISGRSCCLFFLSTLGRWLLSSGKSGRAQSGTDADDVPQRSISGLVAQHTIHGFSVMEMD